MRAAATTKKDVPDDGNPWTCPTKPPNTPPIRNHMVLHAQQTEGTIKEDTLDNKNSLGMPMLQGSNSSSNTNTSLAYQGDQRLPKQNPCRKEYAHHINRVNQTTKATLLEGSLTELSNLGGTPDDKDLLMNKETLELSQGHGINANDSHSVLKNTKHTEVTTLSNKPLSPSQSKTTISITKDLSQTQRLSDQQQDLKDTLRSKQGDAQLMTSAHYPKPSKHNDRSTND